MIRAKKLAKWGLIGVGGLIAVAALAVALGFGWLRSESGRAWLAREIEQAVSTPGEIELTIGSLGGDLPQGLVARDIVLRDGDGPWLTVTAVELDWHPWRLLDRTLDVERLALTGVDLARLPAAAPATAEADSTGSDPRALLDFPLKVRLGRLTADEIALGEPVLGQAARFTLSGEAGRRDDGSLSTRLDLVRLDGIEGRVLAALRYTPQDDSLTADISAASAPGGLLAALLDMPDLPGTEVKLNGSGPLADWAGDFTLHLGDIAEAEARIGLQRLAGDDLGFSLKGGSTIRPPDDSDLWRLAEGRTEIDLAGAWQEGERLHLDHLTTANDRLRLGLQGDVAPDSGALDMKLSAAADDASALATLAGLDRLRSLSAEIAVSGSLDRPQATLDLHGAGLATLDVAVDKVGLSGEVGAESDLFGKNPALRLDLTGRLEKPRLSDQDAVNQVLGDVLPVSLAGRLELSSLKLDIERLEASTQTATLTASGLFNLNDGNAQLDAKAAVNDLAKLQPLTEITLGGQAQLAGPVTLEAFGSRIAADLKGRWDQPTSDIGLIAAAAGKGLDVATRLVIDGGEVRIEEATARSPATDLKASLTVAGGGLRDGRYSLALADATTLAGELGVATAGAAKVEGTIVGPFDALDLTGKAKLARLTIEEQALSDIAATYRLRLKGADIDGPVEVALTSPYGPATAKTGLQLRSDAVTLANLQASLLQTTVNGRVTVPLNGGVPAADLQGEVADLGPLLQIAGLAGGGKGRVAVTLNVPGAKAPFTATADLSAVKLLPEPGATPLSAEHLTLKAEGRDPAFAEPGKVKVVATALTWDKLALKQVDVGAQGTVSALDVTLKTSGKWVEPLELTAAARVTQQTDGLTIALDSAKGRAFRQPLELRQTATVTLAPGTTRLDGLSLASGDTQLTADGALAAGQVTLQAKLEALPMTTVDGFWESGLDGRISAEVTLEGSAAAPRGNARLTATGLRPRDSKDVPALKLTTTADWQDDRLKAEGELGGAEVASARFSADAPLRMTAEGGVEVPPQEPLTGRFDWSGDIRTLLLFVPLPQHRLNGQADIAVSVAGTPADPRADGHITLAKGRYENLETGTVLKNLAFAAEVTDERVTVTELSARDGDGGKLTGEGSMAINPNQTFPFDVAITLDKFHAVRRDDVTAVTSGKVTLDGSIDAPKVTGRFTTDTVEVSLLGALPPDVVSLDVTEVKNGEVVPSKKSEEAKKAAAVDATLDVVVEMPRKIFVRGRGLDSEWSGRISVQGTASAPVVTGTLNLVRGQLSVVGKPFVLKDGKVTLPEGAETDPTLDVTAVHQGKDLTVTARLSGPASHPELELSSVPEVPRDEIVSRVLFGKSTAQLSPAEAAQLAIALRDLTGQGGGADIMGFARRTLGVDVLRIETADTGNPAVEAGKYVTDDVYLGVKQGADSQSTSAGVEVEITPNVTVESEVTAKGANKSGVRFQWDY